MLLGPLLLGSFFILKSNLASSDAPRLSLVFPTLRPQAAIFHTDLLFLNLLFEQKGSHYTCTYTHARTHTHTQQLSSLPQFLHNGKSIPHRLFQPHFLGLLCRPPSVNLLLHCQAQQALPPRLTHSPATLLTQALQPSISAPLTLPGSQIPALSFQGLS